MSLVVIIEMKVETSSRVKSRRGGLAIQSDGELSQESLLQLGVDENGCYRVYIHTLLQALKPRKQSDCQVSPFIIHLHVNTYLLQNTAPALPAPQTSIKLPICN